MRSFMVVATFRPDTNMDEVLAVVPQEQARVAELQSQGRLGTLYLSTATGQRRTVFLHTFGESDEDAVAAVTSLPMAQWWDLDVFPLNGPAEAAGPR